jgi:hypothetical protein
MLTDGLEANAVEFAKRRSAWIHCINGTGDDCVRDPNSLTVQLSKILRWMSWFSVVNSARNPKYRTTGHEPNHLVHAMLNDLFFHSIQVAIRKIVGTGCDKLPLTDLATKKDRSVWSIRALLTDMTLHQPLFTRHAMIHASGLSQQLIPPPREPLGDEMIRVRLVDSRPIDSENRHALIDELVCCSLEQRSLHDTVRPAVFESLIEQSRNTSDRIKDVVDKWIAHAATQSSRASVENVSVTFGDIRTAVREIAEVVNFIRVSLLGMGNQPDEPSAFPTSCVEAIDLLRGIDEPLVASNMMEMLAEEWIEDCQHYRSWRQLDISDDWS